MPFRGEAPYRKRREGNSSDVDGSYGLKFDWDADAEPKSEQDIEQSSDVPESPFEDSFITFYANEIAQRNDLIVDPAALKNYLNSGNAVPLKIGAHNYRLPQIAPAKRSREQQARSGSFGYVCVANHDGEKKDPSKNREGSIAVKVITDHNPSDLRKQMLKRELVALDALQLLRGFTTVKPDVGPPMHVIAMKYIHGLTLEEMIEKKKEAGKAQESLSGVEDTMRMFEDILFQLHIAYNLGIRHRDIKPENIIVSRRKMAHLVDWGTAQAINEDMNQHKVSTPAYTSSAQMEQRFKERASYIGQDLYTAALTFGKYLEVMKPRTTDDMNIRYINVDAEKGSLEYSKFMTRFPFAVDRRFVRWLVSIVKAQENEEYDGSDLPSYEEAITLVRGMRQAHAVVMDAQNVVRQLEKAGLSKDEEYRKLRAALAVARRMDNTSILQENVLNAQRVLHNE